MVRITLDESKAIDESKVIMPKSYISKKIQDLSDRDFKRVQAVYDMEGTDDYDLLSPDAKLQVSRIVRGF